MDYMHLRERFTEVYGPGGGEIRLFFAPGRINLVGEHTDYNGGHVFPCAIEQGVAAAVRVRDDREVHAGRITAEGIKSGDIFIDRENVIRDDDGWLKYPKGIFELFRQMDYDHPRGMDLLYDADLIFDEGLAEGAAFAVLTCLIIKEMSGFGEISQLDLVKFAKRMDNEILKRPSGIMTPSACALGRKGYGILVTADSLRYEYVRLKLGRVKMVITMSSVDYGGYEELAARRRDDERALKKLQSVVHINNLCDISWDKFESCKDVIMNDTVTKRARHVIYEDARAIRATSALKAGNIRRFGELMTQCHESLRDNYEVTCPEIDFLVETALKVPGVLGSRMTGKGFGGSTVSLVEEPFLDVFQSNVSAAYRNRFGLDARFIIAKAADGAREIQLP